MSGEVIDINEELARQMREMEDEERRDFIRNHASRIDAAALVNAGPEAERHDGVILPAKRVWELARELWDAKPEDC